jgi:hypothetical protein
MIDPAAEAMPSQTAPFTLPTPRVDLSLPSVFHAHKATTSLKANQPFELQTGDTDISPPTSANQKASPLHPVAIPVADSPSIRVRIASHPTRLVIATSNQGEIALPDGKIVAGLSIGQPYQVSIGQDGLVIGDRAFPNGMLLLPSTNGCVWVNGHCIEGEFGWFGQRVNSMPLTR